MLLVWHILWQTWWMTWQASPPLCVFCLHTLSSISTIQVAWDLDCTADCLICFILKISSDAPNLLTKKVVHIAFEVVTPSVNHYSQNCVMKKYLFSQSESNAVGQQLLVSWLSWLTMLVVSTLDWARFHHLIYWCSILYVELSCQGSLKHN